MGPSAHFVTPNHSLHPTHHERNQRERVRCNNLAAVDDCRMESRAVIVLLTTTTKTRQRTTRCWSFSFFGHFHLSLSETFNFSIFNFQIWCHTPSRKKTKKKTHTRKKNTQKQTQKKRLAYPQWNAVGFLLRVELVLSLVWGVLPLSFTGGWPMEADGPAF